MTLKKSALDPLFVIFENHLLQFEDSNIDRKTFSSNVVGEYLKTLKNMKIAVPSQYEKAIVEELTDQVNQMLVKKIYGCYSIQEFVSQMPAKDVRRAKARYKKLQKKTG